MSKLKIDSEKQGFLEISTQIIDQENQIIDQENQIIDQENQKYCYQYEESENESQSSDSEKDENQHFNLFKQTFLNKQNEQSQKAIKLFQVISDIKIELNSKKCNIPENESSLNNPSLGISFKALEYKNFNAKKSEYEQQNKDLAALTKAFTSSVSTDQTSEFSRQDRKFLEMQQNLTLLKEETDTQEGRPRVIVVQNLVNLQELSENNFVDRVEKKSESNKLSMSFDELDQRSQEGQINTQFNNLQQKKSATFLSSFSWKNSKKSENLSSKFQVKSDGIKNQDKIPGAPLVKAQKSKKESSLSGKEVLSLKIKYQVYKELINSEEFSVLYKKELEEINKYNVSKELIVQISKIITLNDVYDKGGFLQKIKYVSISAVVQKMKSKQDGWIGSKFSDAMQDVLLDRIIKEELDANEKLILISKPKNYHLDKWKSQLSDLSNFVENQKEALTPLSLKSYNDLEQFIQSYEFAIAKNDTKQISKWSNAIDKLINSGSLSEELKKVVEKHATQNIESHKQSINVKLKKLNEELSKITTDLNEQINKIQGNNAELEKSSSDEKKHKEGGSKEEEEENNTRQERELKNIMTKVDDNKLLLDQTQKNIDNSGITVGAGSAEFTTNHLSTKSIWGRIHERLFPRKQLTLEQYVHKIIQNTSSTIKNLFKTTSALQELVKEYEAIDLGVKNVVKKINDFSNTIEREIHDTRHTSQYPSCQKINVQETQKIKLELELESVKYLRKTFEQKLNTQISVAQKQLDQAKKTSEDLLFGFQQDQQRIEKNALMITKFYVAYSEASEEEKQIMCLKLSKTEDVRKMIPTYKNELQEYTGGSNLKSIERVLEMKRSDIQKFTSNDVEEFLKSTKNLITKTKKDISKYEESIKKIESIKKDFQDQGNLLDNTYTFLQSESSVAESDKLSLKHQISLFSKIEDVDSKLNAISVINQSCHSREVSYGQTYTKQIKEIYKETTDTFTKELGELNTKKALLFTTGSKKIATFKEELKKTMFDGIKTIHQKQDAAETLKSADASKLTTSGINSCKSTITRDAVNKLMEYITKNEEESSVHDLLSEQKIIISHNDQVMIGLYRDIWKSQMNTLKTAESRNVDSVCKFIIKDKNFLTIQEKYSDQKYNNASVNVNFVKEDFDKIQNIYYVGNLIGCKYQNFTVEKLTPVLKVLQNIGEVVEESKILSEYTMQKEIITDLNLCKSLVIHNGKLDFNIEKDCDKNAAQKILNKYNGFAEDQVIQQYLDDHSEVQFAGVDQ